MNRNIFLVFLCICCLATGGIFVRYSELGPISTGMYRVLFSLPVFLWMSRGQHAEISRNGKILAVLAGAFLAFDLILWNISFSYTTVANANLLANLVPFTVVPLSYWLYREKVRRAFFIGGGIVLIGLVILLSGKIEPSPRYFKGDLLAACTSIFYGLFIITIYKLRHQSPTLLIMSYASIGSLLVLTPVALLVEGVQTPQTLANSGRCSGLPCAHKSSGKAG